MPDFRSELSTIEPTEERRQKRPWWKRPRVIVPIYVITFVAIEVLGAFVNVGLQAAADAILAFVAINHAVFGYRTERTAGLVMAALFTTRLMVLTLPAADISTPTRTALVAVATIMVAYITTWVLGQDIASGRSEEGFGLKKPFGSARLMVVVTILSALPIGWVAHLLLDPPSLPIDPLFHSTTLALLVAAGALSLGALGEELLYRRLVAAMVQHTGQSQTPLISGVLFAATYLGMQNAAFTILTFATGTWFAWSCERTGSLKPVVAAHAIISIMVFLVW